MVKNSRGERTDASEVKVISDIEEEHRLRVSENRVLRRIFGPKKEEVAGEDYIMRSFITCTLHQILLG
jgi:hypothetical protein